MDIIFGYGFDLFLFSVSSENRETFHSPDGRLTARPCADRLRNIRGLLSDGGGVLYNVSTVQEESGGVLFLQERPRGGSCPFAFPWMSAEDAADIRHVTLDAAYREAFSALLLRVMETSPVGKVYVQIRCQGLEKSNLVGTLTPGIFLEQLVNADVLWGNMTYILAQNADVPEADLLNAGIT